MSDLPDASAKIQTEGAQFRAPVSESLIQAVGGAINFILDKVNPVATVIMSELTEAQFQAEIPTTTQEWILSDGRSVAGSSYQTKTGNANVPDRRGIYAVGKNNGRSDGNQDPAGELALGQFSGSASGGHVHQWYQSSGGNIAGTSFNSGGGSIGLTTTPNTGFVATAIVAGDISSLAVPSVPKLTGGYYTGATTNTTSQTTVNRCAVNYFVRIN